MQSCMFKQIHYRIKLIHEDSKIFVSPAMKNNSVPPMVGTTWALITNMVI